MTFIEDQRLNDAKSPSRRQLKDISSPSLRTADVFPVVPPKITINIYLKSVEKENGKK